MTVAVPAARCPILRTQSATDGPGGSTEVFSRASRTYGVILGLFYIRNIAGRIS